ncbi:MAG: alpha/beta fold hydrolase [Chloroflexi bacterium]|nr:MAG: alpha/beta fold hydrolase [Chloroflexota bacterium]
MRAMPEPEGPSGRDYLAAVLAGRIPGPPYASLLNMRLTAFAEGSATFEMPIREEHYNPNQVVHGGAIASLADSAMGLAVFSTLAPSENFTTAEFKVNFLRPLTVESGTLRGTGKVIHRGRQVAVAEANVVDGKNQLVAYATSTNLILPRRAELSVVEAPTEVAQPPAPRFDAPPSPLEHSPASATPSQPSLPPIAAAPLAQGKRRVRVSVGDIAYLRKGQGPPVVLIHGIPSSSYLWRDLIDPLAEHFDVLAPDLVGYGDSDKRLDADLSVAAQARYLVAFMESLGVHRAAVIGHDIGGGIAQLIAVDAPGRVAKLVLIDSIVDNAWPIPEIARLKEPAWDQIMVGLDLRAGLRKGLEAGITTPDRVTDELVDEWVRPFNDVAGRRAYLRAARALNNRDLVSRSRHIDELDIPTLVLWGANDRFLEPRWGEHLKGKLRNAKLQVIDPGGHFLPLDRPDVVSAAVTEFLTAS